MKIFQFACAAIDITPSVGIHMGGYWGRRSGATHIHDRLMAKALVCELGEERVVILTVDLVALGADAVRAIRMAVKRDTGIAGAAIMICASHTHAGPLTIPYRGMGEIDKSYLDRVEDPVDFDSTIIQASQTLAALDFDAFAETKRRVRQATIDRIVALES